MKGLDSMCSELYLTNLQGLQPEAQEACLDSQAILSTPPFTHPTGVEGFMGLGASGTMA